MLKSNQRSRIAVWGILIGLLAAYVLAFVYLHNIIGLSVGMLIAVPIVIAAWYFGSWISLIFTLAALLIYIGLSYLFGFTSREIFIRQGGVLGIPVSFVITLVIGKLGEMTRQQKQEAVERQRDLSKNDTDVRFMTLLNEIVRASLEAEDMPTLLDVLVTRTGELFSADECFITRWDEAQKATIPVAAYGPASQTYNHLSVEPGKRTLTSAVLDAGRALVVEDIDNNPYVDPEAAPKPPFLRSALTLPLIARGQKLGALILGFDQPHQFSAEEIERGELAARQMSLAMTKVILLEEARSRVRELAGLHRISQTFTLHGDDRQTYGMLTEILAGLMGTEICVISLYDEAAQELRAQVPAYNLGDELVTALHFPVNTGGRIWGITEGRPFKSNSVDELPPEFIPLARSLKVDCFVAAPMQDAEQKMMGAIFVVNKPGGFSDEDVHLITVFANQVVVVIQNTRLLSTERKRAEELAVLHAVATATTEADNEDELIQRVTRLIGQRLYQGGFDTFLLDEGTLELYLHSSYNRTFNQDSLRFPLGIGIPGAVAKSGKPRRVNDVTKAPEYLSYYPLTRSELCVPLKVEEQIIGVVNTESGVPNAFSTSDEELLTILAGQLATAIQRLRTVKAEHHQAEQLGRSNALIRALAQLGARASAASDPDGVMQTLGSELAKLGMLCFIALSDSEYRYAKICYTSLPKRTVRSIESISGQKLASYSIPLERFSNIADRPQNSSIIGDPNMLVMNLLPGAPRQTVGKILKTIGMMETTSVCHLPLMTEGKPIGILWMWGEGLHEGDLPTMSLFASQVATALQNAKLMAEVQRLAITDELTGIFNRRHFYDLAEKEFNRAKRYNQPLAALIVDIDHFKQFNDRFGHLIGDVVLRGVAQLLEVSLRDSDILGRYGGEEFAVLLPVTEMNAAIHAAERLLSHVAKASIHTEAGDLQVQVSVGVAGISKETPTLQTLISRADQAMYMAKDAGRNRVAVK